MSRNSGNCCAGSGGGAPELYRRHQPPWPQSSAHPYPRHPALCLLSVLIFATPPPPHSWSHPPIRNLMHKARFSGRGLWRDVAGWELGYLATTRRRCRVGTDAFSFVSSCPICICFRLTRPLFHHLLRRPAPPPTQWCPSPARKPGGAGYLRDGILAEQARGEVWKGATRRPDVRRRNWGLAYLVTKERHNVTRRRRRYNPVLVPGRMRQSESRPARGFGQGRRGGAASKGGCR